MTIAVGLRSNRGIVLCADTELSVGDVKTYDGKVDLHIFHDQGKYRLTFALAGAGDTDYIRTAQSQLMKEFPKCQNVAEVEAQLEKRWLEFFNKHLAPWAYFPQHDRPYVELLIAVSGKGNVFPTLYHCTGTAFHETWRKAIGSGVILANDMLNSYTVRQRTVEDDVVLGTYIVAKAKRLVQHCGGSTHVIALRKDGDFALSDKTKIDKLEKELMEVEGEADKERMDKLLAKKVPVAWMSDIPKKTRAQNKELPARGSDSQ